MDETSYDAILVGDKLFRPLPFELESDLNNAITSISDFVYGSESVYFDWEKKVVSSGKKYNVTDGLLLDLSSKPYKFWIIEYELSKHAVYGHVQPQIMNFIRSLNKPRTIRDIQQSIYHDIQSDEEKSKRIRNKIGNQDIYYFLDQILNSSKGVLLVIDELTAQLEDVIEDLYKLATDLKVIEFKRYKHKEEIIFRFSPLSPEEIDIEIKTPQTETKKERPPHRINWEARLQWVQPEARQIVKFTTEKILELQPTTVHQPKNRWYYFHTGRPSNLSNLYAAYIVTKQKLYVRMRMPENYIDPNERVKTYKGWFFSKGQETALEITKLEDINLLDEYLQIAFQYTKRLQS